MNKVRIIVGLPGSGKTYFAEHYPIGILYDDPAAASKIFDQLKYTVKSGQDVTITDIYMIDPQTRSVTIPTLLSWNPNIELEWFFFENDPAACVANVERRNDGRKVSSDYIYEMSKVYTLPPWEPTIPVYKP